MRITIEGHDLPGRQFTSAGDQLENVHVGTLDLRGPAVHGSRGDRFLYLTWGDVDPDGSFAMFRRAKLMIADIEPDLLTATAAGDGNLVATIGLTDACRAPLCARVRPPAVRWHAR
ncbi:MAG: DUF5990 family protein [Actinomycetota bacterium]|nr:DUF5990 family protein [Actinomycetota bacterium]